MPANVNELAEVVDRTRRRDPIEILVEQDATRLPDLVPVRHERMGATPFTFFRGAAAVMAADLAATPSSGIITQLCGDAHLSNFGMFRSPERAMVFDLNDFDETHPGPFEWDVKRLAASLAIASQHNGFDDDRARKCARAAAKSYRKTIMASAGKTGLECWYDRVNADDVLADIGSRFDTNAAAHTQKTLAKARHRDSAQALSKLCHIDAAGVHINSNPPLLVPAHEVATHMTPAHVKASFEDGFARYRDTLPSHIAVLFDQYRLVEAARKVVGVGSVGTRCWIALFAGQGVADPFFLQLKEAQQSVLAPYVPGYEYANQGERVVFGQQLMQASSDIFLGWVSTLGLEMAEIDFYVRQLRDGKGSVVIEALVPRGMMYYARLCGEVLAQAHARTGARTDIADYLGTAGKVFDAAIADFSIDYSRLNMEDHDRVVAAIADGSLSSATL